MTQFRLSGPVGLALSGAMGVSGAVSHNGGTAPGGTPAWRAGQIVNEWREIPGSSLSLAPSYAFPGQNSITGKLDSWIGWHIDTRTSKVYSVANGGHNDYYGNEVDVIDLTADAPAWAEIYGPSPASAVTSSSDYYSDGRPASRHSYMSQVFIESLDRAMLFPGQSKATIGFATGKLSAFNIATNTYDSEATWPITFNVAGTGPLTCVKHPVTEDVYMLHSNDGVWRWNKGVPGSFTKLANVANATYTYYTAGAFDSTRNRILFLGTGSGSGPLAAYFDLADDTYNTISDLAESVLGNGSGNGMAYVPAIDRFVVRRGWSGNSGGTVYLVHPTTWAVTTLATTGGGEIPTSSGSLGGAAPFTKFLYVPALGGIVYGLGVWSSNLWFLRLH